jgi:hypothetical protein
MKFARNLAVTLKAIANTKASAIRYQPWVFYAGNNPHATAQLVNKQLKGSPAYVNNGFVEVKNGDITAVSAAARTLWRALDPNNLIVIDSRSAFIVNTGGIFDVHASLVQRIKDVTGVQAAESTKYNLPVIVFTGAGEQINKVKEFLAACHEGSTPAPMQARKNQQTEKFMARRFHNDASPGLTVAARTTIVTRLELPAYRHLCTAAIERTEAETTALQHRTPVELFNNAANSIAVNASVITFTAAKTLHKGLTWEIVRQFGGEAQVSYRENKPGYYDYAISACPSRDQSLKVAENMKKYFESVASASNTRKASSRNHNECVLSLADALNKLQDAHLTSIQKIRNGM